MERNILLIFSIILLNVFQSVECITELEENYNLLLVSTETYRQLENKMSPTENTNITKKWNLKYQTTSNELIRDLNSTIISIMPRNSEWYVKDKAFILQFPRKNLNLHEPNFRILPVPPRFFDQHTFYSRFIRSIVKSSECIFLYKNTCAFTLKTNDKLIKKVMHILIAAGNDCKSQPCQNGGTCRPEPHGYQCICKVGFKGQYCEENIDDCYPDACLNGGTCVDKVDNFVCICPRGFTGVNCYQRIPCAPTGCLNGGTCDLDEVDCICRRGFTGQFCETNIDDCAADLCQVNAMCFDGFYDVNCCCDIDHVGKYCKNEKRCNNELCNNRGKCIVRNNTEICRCLKLYKGKYCEIEIKNCSVNHCKNGGLCVPAYPKNICRCPPSHKGNDCSEERYFMYALNFQKNITTEYSMVVNSRLLEEVTFAFWMKVSTLQQRGTLFSYSYLDPIKYQDELHGFGLSDTSYLKLYMFGKKYLLEIKPNTNWHHFAVTWKSDSGEASVYWDGKLNRIINNVRRGRLLWNGVLVLGQEQVALGEVSFIGHFSKAETYLGKIIEFNVWDIALSSSSIKDMYQTCTLGLIGNVIAWDLFRDHLHGSVQIEDNVRICSGTGFCKNNCFCYSQSMLTYEQCGKDIGTCNPSPCKNKAQCVFDNGISQCDCPEGFRGVLCQYDIDECIENRHKCSHLCQNTLGSYKCYCPLDKKMFRSKCIDKQKCVVDGTIYSPGNSWIKNCQNCKCNNGTIACHKLCDNEDSCREGEMLSLDMNGCCDKCFKVSNCTLNNGEVITMDGYSHRFAGICRYALVDDCISKNYGERRCFRRWISN
ncbi:sushi, von Willebrand factor type A, EGF and pentraxin domain-containing protein 1-like isoform X3 [Centruroides sculpturatus]|uniref:sushi, von Willebrand factor type A, EGF and pentraxin domain-containing protein 1-like isoform X3 n=1 Tax=Centruroides sculpturatus TaxID=218467 RepID=UPI000C6ED71E|nr:sushi, von Willebrand factor type A, EGF and pentraxin domain-containing protein 1-like isoform X3 [Centruroides sculpturatus]